MMFRFIIIYFFIYIITFGEETYIRCNNIAKVGLYELSGNRFLYVEKVINPETYQKYDKDHKSTISNSENKIAGVIYGIKKEISFDSCYDDDVSGGYSYLKLSKSNSITKHFLTGSISNEVKDERVNELIEKLKSRNISIHDIKNEKDYNSLLKENVTSFSHNNTDEHKNDTSAYSSNQTQSSNVSNEATPENTEIPTDDRPSKRPRLSDSKSESPEDKATDNSTSTEIPTDDGARTRSSIEKPTDDRTIKRIRLSDNKSESPEDKATDNATSTESNELKKKGTKRKNDGKNPVEASSDFLQGVPEQKHAKTSETEKLVLQSNEFITRDFYYLLKQNIESKKKNIEPQDKELLETLIYSLSNRQIIFLLAGENSSRNLEYIKILIVRNSEPQYKSGYDVYLVSPDKKVYLVKGAGISIYSGNNEFIRLSIGQKYIYTIRGFNLFKTRITSTEKKINTLIFPLLNNVIGGNAEYYIDFSYNLKVIRDKIKYLQDRRRELLTNNYIVLLNPIYIDNHEFSKNETSDKYVAIIIKKTPDESLKISLNLITQMGTLQNVEFMTMKINASILDLAIYPYFKRDRVTAFNNTIALCLPNLQINISNYYIVEVKNKLTGK